VQDNEHIKQVPASVGLSDVIAHRWSPRSFADKAISSEDLTKIFTAAGWAASSSNEQPWRFLVGHKGDDTYAKILDCLVEANQAWAKAAPVLVLSAAAATFAKNQAPNYYALHDTGAASATMTLEAIALGIHAHGMGGFDKDKARTSFAIPAEYEIGACWAFGYLGDPNALADWQFTAETTPRTRKPLSEFVFSAWNEPAKL
jgi:nitroreductase